MSLVTVTWAQPTTRVGGVALAASEIAYVDALLSFNGGPFASIAHVTGVSTTIVPSLAPGNYTVRLFVVDKQVPPKSSAPVDKPFVVAAAPPPPPPALADPSPVTGVTVAVT